MNKIIHPAARFLVALIFIMSGIGKLFAFGATSAMMGAVGFPAPSFFLVCAIAIEIVAGACLLMGFKTKYAALALVVFLIPATIIFHAAGVGDPVHGQEQLVHTLKNIAIMGALLKFAADGAGLFAIDNFFAKKNPAERDQLTVEIEDAVSA